MLVGLEVLPLALHTSIVARIGASEKVGFTPTVLLLLHPSFWRFRWRVVGVGRGRWCPEKRLFCVSGRRRPCGSRR